MLIPPNWDSWGKIRVLREGFDVEGTSSGWSIDVHPPPPSSIHNTLGGVEDGREMTTLQQTSGSPEGAVLPAYESTIPNPRKSKSTQQPNQKPSIELSVQPNQEFLAAQLETLTRLQSENSKDTSKTPPSATTTSQSLSFNNNSREHDERVSEQIGPVRVNMGGIQVDADDMLKRLKNRGERDHSRSKTPERDVSGGIGVAAAQTPEEQRIENEKLSSFFANLAKRGVSGSPRNTPGKAAGGKDTPSKKA